MKETKDTVTVKMAKWQFTELQRLEKMYEEAFTTPGGQGERAAILSAIERNIWKETDRLERLGLHLGMGKKDQ